MSVGNASILRPLSASIALHGLAAFLAMKVGTGEAPCVAPADRTTVFEVALTGAAAVQTGASAPILEEKRPLRLEKAGAVGWEKEQKVAPKRPTPDALGPKELKTGAMREKALKTKAAPGSGGGVATAELPGTSPAYRLGRGETPRPPYPYSARVKGIEGRVVIRLEVDRQGRVSAARVAEGSGHRVLDEAALSALKAWRLTPARQGGRAVEGRLDVPIRFVLLD